MMIEYILALVIQSTNLPSLNYYSEVLNNKYISLYQYLHCIARAYNTMMTLQIMTLYHKVDKFVRKP